jgi:hypothetical protein
MRIRIISKSRNAGFTSAEMVVATAVMAILGVVMFNVLNSGLILYAKNTAVNSAHQEARQGINRLTRDIHAAVSVPQLRSSSHDATYTVTGSYAVASSAPVGGVAPTAAGVSFQNVVPGSPDYVWQDPNSSTLILIKDPGDVPTAGMRLIVPFWQIEDDINKVTGSPTTSGHSNIFLVNGGDVTVASKARKYGQSSYSGYSSPYAITYYTERMLYVVENGTYIADSQGPWILSGGQYVAYTSGAMQRYRYENGELNVYHMRYSVQNGNNGYFYWCPLDKQADYNPTWYNNTAIHRTTVAHYISSPQPFYVPLNSGGTADTKYVGVNLTARDPKSSNRGYLATASLLNTQIDYRSRICLYQ